MKIAIDEARLSLEEGGIPIGSALIKHGEVVAQGHSRRLQDNDRIMHAEIASLQKASRIGSYREAVLYTTLMPCYLCAGAVVYFGIKKVIVGESKTFRGERGFMESHGVEVIDLDLEECRLMMQQFIKQTTGYNFRPGQN
jgi:cytosine deaminase